MSFVVTGKITEIGLETEINGKAKTDFTIEFTEGDKGQFVAKLNFDVWDKTADNLNKYNAVGDKVEVSFNIRQREHLGKTYTSLSAWKIFKQQ